MQNLKLIILIMLCCIFACSLDSSSSPESEELLETIPDLVFIKFIHTSVKAERMTFQLEAEKAQLFNKKKLIALNNIRFIIYNDDGSLSLEGEGKEAIFNIETENATIKGQIWCYSYNEAVTFYAEELEWESEKRILRSLSNTPVRIEKEDGSYIEGSYFSLDNRRRIISFEGSVYGKYINNEQKDEEKNTD